MKPLGALILLLLAAHAGALAQSTDIQYPTPVRSNEISGAIAPRDIGDPRLTRYFYSFTGTPGDLIVSVESRNLEGDVDVFTAGALRPLAKLSMYAGVAASGSKTIYLRTRQPLILRVEARTPNDDQGSFRISFQGAFEPIGSEVPDPEPVTPTLSSTTAKPGRRVTATGARIEEPEPETTATNTQPETPAPANETPPGENPASTDTPATATATEPRPRSRTPSTRRARNRRSRSPQATRRTPAPAESSTAPQPLEPASGPRLIIETRDGMRVERYMTTVRRVTVERGQIVVVTTDGKIERQPMANVLRMAIEP
ncbi:MAG TPA: hypothetical protein VJT09_15135 [Pyrinomonadaceae bacterium]|nr:hypothetical protein [Pyrinomonadaceae bacterium]